MEILCGKFSSSPMSRTTSPRKKTDFSRIENEHVICRCNDRKICRK